LPHRLGPRGAGGQLPKPRVRNGMMPHPRAPKNSSREQPARLRQGCGGSRRSAEHRKRREGGNDVDRSRILSTNSEQGQARRARLSFTTAPIVVADDVLEERDEQ
jgi:hypothetical protein